MCLVMFPARRTSSSAGRHSSSAWAADAGLRRWRSRARGAPGRRGKIWRSAQLRTRGHFSSRERTLRVDEHSGPALRALDIRRNLRDEITQTLRAAVISGELRSGVVYSAPQLAAQFGVSATPVREAMLDLTKEALIEAVRYTGFRVTDPTGKDPRPQ